MAQESEERQRVIEAAAELIGREGIGAASHERVAKLAGLRERQVRRLFPDLDELRLTVLALPQESAVAEIVARIAASQEVVPPMSLLVEAGHRLYAGARSNWTDTDLEAILRAPGNPEFAELARERLAERSGNARTVIGRGATSMDPAVDIDALTHLTMALSVGLAMIDPVATVRPTVQSWDALFARIGGAMAKAEDDQVDDDVTARWRLRVDLPQRARALSDLFVVLGGLHIYPVEGQAQDSTEEWQTIYLGLLAPKEVSADVILAAARSIGQNAYIAPAPEGDARDVFTRTLDGATQLVKHPEEAPQIAGALVAADSVEVVDASEGADNQHGVLRLQWTPNRHVLLRREWCPFSRTERARASALLRLSAAVARLSGDDEQSGWIEQVKGGTVWIRLARPEDADAVAAMHERSSERTRYLRYFSTIEWRDLQMQRLSGGHRGATLVAMWRDGSIIGLGNVFPEGPLEEATAEIAVLVEDAYQGCGVGRALMARMLEVAEHLGFARVAAHMIPDNSGIMRLLASTGLTWHRSVSDGVANWVAELPAAAL